MIVVLDINALLVSIPRKSKYRPIFDALISGKFRIVLSNEILSEYIEIIQQKSSSLVANNITDMLINLENLLKVDTYFRWDLIKRDGDDNKYVDAAIAGSADYLVTNDKHFDILKDLKFPFVNVISIDGFLDFIININN